MRHLLFTLYSFFCISVFAQNIPEVKLKNNKSLKLSELHIKVNITGNIALTTYNMKFYNATNRILEGELAFPLGQGQSVTDFAMDVNGELRHAVIVEKELGRVAYENTIKQKIDPGLLEMTKGNNYKARVYPIPANGYKELEITYEQVLLSNNKKHRYLLPLNFNKSIPDFSCEIVVHDKKNVRFIENNYYKSLRFSNSNGNKKAFFESEDFTPKVAINIEMELGDKESLTTYNQYFNFYKTFDIMNSPKEKPKSITMFWDASYSMEYRKLKKEIDFLNKYFNYLKNVKLKLVIFNTHIKTEKSYFIKNGNWSKLKKEIESVVYDGGTSFSNLSKYNSDVYLFFTDGMFNLGDFNNGNKSSVYTINAVTSANHNKLSQIARETGGNYINLINQSIETAFNSITNNVYQFLGIVNNENVYEVYPNVNTNVNEDFSLSGKFSTNTPVLKLLFGYNNKVTDTLQVKIRKGNNNRLVKRLWAKQKLNSLSLNSKKNKDEIIKLAKKNRLITSYTSMIILDRIEDYVKYKIEPSSRLKNQNKYLVKNEEQQEKERLEDLKERKEDLYDEYVKLFEWYTTDFSKLKKAKQVVKVTENQEESISRTDTVPQPNRNETNVISQIQVSSQNNSRIIIDSSKRTVSGIVKGVEGEVLPGVNLYIENKNNRAVSDFDGNYIINAEVGDVLVFSYIGYIGQEVTLSSETVVNASLKEDTSQLEEVVIIGYGVQKRSSIVGSVTSVKSESVTSALQGRVAGVEVLNTTEQVGDVVNIRIRGVNSESDKVMPLYVVDGVPYSKNVLKDISSDDIDSISILKDGGGSSIYGTKAANGVVIITTKKGLIKKTKAINALNEKLKKEIEFKPWTATSKYLEDLSKTKSTDEAYRMYLELRKTYKNTPTFFIDVADFFGSIKEKDLAIQIVTNLIEKDLDNHELIRALAYKLEFFEVYDLAVHVYAEVLKLRPEEPHSYRDLALVYEQVGEYQKAFDLLYSIIDGKLLEKDEEERFLGIENLAYVEACHLVTKYGGKLNLNAIQKKLIKEFKVDIRVVIDWNHNDTDLDLWIENPNSEKLLYKNKNSTDGGRISEDMTEGYGPEEFMIKNAKKGAYEILVDYYADEVQKISGPTSLKVTIFTNYGSKNETREVRILRLDKEEDEIEVGVVRI